MACANSEHSDVASMEESNANLISERIEGLEITHEEVDDGQDMPYKTPFKFAASTKMRSDVPIHFPDIVSTATCSELIIELIKYILYLKEQIPYQYNRLKFVVEKKKKWDVDKTNVSEYSDRPHIPRSTVILAEKYFNKSSLAVEALEQTFKALRDEMPGANAVALLLGATIASPQEAYVVELPPLFSVPPGSAPSRRCLTHFLGELMTSESLQKMTSRPSKPCNIYIMIRKPTSDKESWFDIKPLFSLPKRCHQVSLKFLQPPSSSDPNFTIYKDLQSLQCPSPMCKTMNAHEPEDCPCDTSQWFQAHKLLKGFKDCWIGSESATDIWMKV